MTALPPPAHDTPLEVPLAGDPQTTGVIAARGVTKLFGEQRALDDITLSIPSGVIVGLIGPSGCGKTTLIRTLTGITEPTTGKVRVFGANPVEFTTRQRRRFGYMPQLPVLFPNLTVWGNLSFIASVYGLSMRRRKRHLTELLDLVDLTPHRHKRLSNCSGGMQRRLTLAATLVHDPELLYLDEPTAGVDPILRERFWTHFRMLRDQGRTIVVPTQYVGEAVSCDVVAVMANGRLITVQPPDALVRVAYGGDPLVVHLDNGWLSGGEVARLTDQPFVRTVRRNEEGLMVVVDDAARQSLEVEQFFERAGVPVGRVVALEPSLDDIFVQIIQANTSAAERAAA